MGKVALGVMAAILALAVAFSVAVEGADAKPRPAKHRVIKRGKIVKRWKTSTGYQCHRHRGRVRPHKGTDWSSRKVHGRSFTHCRKLKPKRAKRHGSSAWVLPAYVVRCESGGNPRVVNRTAAGAANGYPAGLYQITSGTWAGYGGRAFAPTADGASVYEQGVIALRVLHAQGPRAWACW